MISAHYLNHGRRLVAEGRPDIALIDEAVIRVLELKDALGLFDSQFKDADPAAAEAGAHIGLAGPFALSTQVLGAWTGSEWGTPVSLYEGLVGKTSLELVRTAMTGELGSMLEDIFDVEDFTEEPSTI